MNTSNNLLVYNLYYDNLDCSFD